VKGVGMQQAGLVQHHAHMAFPEDYICAPQVRRGGQIAAPVRLAK